MASSTEHIDDLLEWQPGAADAARTNVFAAFAWGARRAARARMLIVLLWLLYLALSLGAGGALVQLLRDPGAATEAVGPVLDNALRGDVFGRPLGRALYRTVAFEALTRQLWVPQAYFLVFYVLAAGAAIAFLHSPRPAPLLSQLGAACGMYCGRFARLLVLAAAIFWIIQRGADMLQANRASGLLIALLVSGYFAAAAIVDYARVRTVARDSRSMLLELARSARFVVRNLPRTLALEVLLVVVAALLGALAIAVEAALSTMLPARPAALVAGQVLAMGLLWLRLAAWGAMLSLYQGITLQRLRQDS